MATTTVTKICTTALRKIGLLAGGVVATGQELIDARDELERMLETWLLEGTTVYAHTIRTHSLLPAAAAYDIGPGQTFDAPRPVNILGATLRNTAGSAYPLQPMTAREYSAANHRDSVGRPSRFYYQPTFPYGQVRFDMVPDDPMVELVTLEQLELPADPDDDVSLPPGYTDAIIYNLALRVAGEYEIAPGQEIFGLAASFKALIKRANFEVPELLIDFPSRGLRGTYDINAGPVT